VLIFGHGFIWLFDCAKDGKNVKPTHRLFVGLDVFITMYFTPRLCYIQALLLLLNNSWEIKYKVVVVQRNF
jgi:hypothetical protein